MPSIIKTIPAIFILILYLQPQCLASVPSKEDSRRIFDLQIGLLKKTLVFREDLIKSIDSIPDISLKTDPSRAVQAYISFAVMSELGELISNVDILGHEYFISSVMHWRRQSNLNLNQTLLNIIHENQRSVFEYVEKMLKTQIQDSSMKDMILNLRRNAEDIISDWPFKEASEGTQEKSPFETTPTNNKDFYTLSHQLAETAQTISHRYEPEGTIPHVIEEATEAKLFFYSQTRAVAPRVLNTMAVMTILHITQTHDDIPGLKRQSEYVDGWLKIYFPGFDNLDQGIQNIASKTTDQKLRQEAQLYHQQYMAWRKALQEFLAEYGLTLPATATAPATAQ